MKRILCIVLLFTVNPLLSKENETIYLWPDLVPGQTEPKVAPSISDKKQGNVTRINKVTNPALIVYKPNATTHNGAAVIISPGGGYSILAIDKEGYEIAEWLSSIGYTAFVLQYRVPKNPTGALQDAQRAIRYVRGTAKRWGVDTNLIGTLGFSAGGSLSARLSTRYAEVLYEPINEFDNISARPDFSVLIYPAYLDKGINHSITPEIKVDKNTPPMFIYVASNDRHANSSLVMGSELQKNQIPFELHVQPKGGHGFGMRSGNQAAQTWPALCEAWLTNHILNVTLSN